MLTAAIQVRLGQFCLCLLILTNYLIQIVAEYKQIIIMHA